MSLRLLLLVMCSKLASASICSPTAGTLVQGDPVHAADFPVGTHASRSAAEIADMRLRASSGIAQLSTPVRFGYSARHWPGAAVRGGAPAAEFAAHQARKPASPRARGPSTAPNLI